MSNINVRVVGTANVSQMSSAFGKLQGQVTALNAQMAQMVALQNGVDPTGYERMTKAAALNSKHFRNAAASTGMFEVQQLKLNRATDDYIQKLTKQQMSFRELAKQRKIAAAAYKEQLAMENMVVRKNAGGSVHGKDMLDVTYPREVSKQLDTAGKRLAFFNEQLKSGAHQMVNWGKNTQWAGRQLMVGFTMPMAAFGAAAGVMAYQIDKQLTRIAKVYDTNADLMSDNLNEVKAAEKELMDLREQATQTAINAARSYGVAATDTLEVQAELAAVGMKGRDLQESTNQVVRIATLGEIDHAVATKAMISLQATLGATVEDTAKAFDFMNSVENATSLATADFAAAIPRALGPMREMSREGASAQEVLENLSILMVAMKERGIEAGEGANAVKALMSRVYRPSKQVRSEWEAMGLGDPATFAKQGKDIMEILGMVGDAVRDLKGNERTQALAGLFGTYQVARMNAMLKGLDNVNKEGSQVARTFDVMSEGAKSWGETADQEIKTYAESLAGRFERAKEELKVQLSTLGEPFVEVATVVISGLSKIINWFNELPKGVKIAVATVAGFAAVAGPVVMLTGLLANLSGQALKGIASIVNLGAKMKIIPKESRAAALAADMVTNGFIEQRNAVEQLTLELRELAAAQAEANRLTAGGAATRAAGAASVVDEVDDGQMMLFGTDDVDNSKKIADNLDDAEDSTKKTAASGDKVKRGFQAAGVASAAMAAGMLLTFTNSNNAVNAIGDFLLISSMVVPAVSMIAPHIKTAGRYALDTGRKLASAAKAAAAARGGVMGMAAGARAATVAAAGMVHPVGWIALAVTAVGVGIWAWRNHLKEVAKEQARLHNSVNSMADKWAESVGKARKEWAGVVLEMGKAVKLRKQEERYKEYSSGDMKQVVTDYKSDEFNERDRLIFLREHYMELQAEYGLSQKEAAMNVRALLAAAGEGLATQNSIAEDLLDTYGKITQANIGDYIQTQLDMANSKDFGTKEWETAAADAADAFVMGFNQNMGPGQAKKMVEQFTKGATRQWSVAFAGISDDPAVRNALGELGIKTGDQLRAAVAESGGVDKFIAEHLSALGPGAEASVEQMRGALKDASIAEREFFGGISGSSKMLGIALDDNIDTVDEFVNHWIVGAQGLDLSSAQQHVKDLREQLVVTGSQTNLLMQTAQDFGGQNFNNVKGLAKMLKNLPTEDAEEFGAAMTTIAKMQGIKLGKNDAETYFNIIRGVRAETKGAADETERMARAVEKLSAADLAGVQQSAWENLQQEIADTYREDLDDQHESQMEDRREYWDNRQEALDEEFDRRQEALDNRHERESRQLDRRHERETNQLESKWESRLDKATEYWDRRVDGVNKAIEAEEKAEQKRQKMFDAEIARINKLNDMANANIDFNVALNEGNFDEAAKIRNDITAGDAQTALERAAAAGTARSERRIDRLGGRLEHIEKARDEHMKILEDRADAERKALQRSQEREQRALEKSQEAQKKHLEEIAEMRKKALQDQTDADIKALEKEQEREKESLDKQMDMFLAHTARNKKELKEHMKKVGLSYDDFGDKLKKKGNNWARFFRDNLYDHIRQATRKIQSDKMWEKLGKKSRNEILRGMGFNSWSAFNKFVRTGVMPKGGGAKPATSGGGGRRRNGNRGDGATTSGDDTPRGFGAETRHEGGEIGSGKGSSRKGVARSLLGLHSSETMVRAQKGEFMVNRDAAQRNADILHRINSGEDVGDTGVRHGTPRYGKGGPGGPAPFMAGVMANMFAAGLKKGVQKVYQDTVAKQAAATALYSAGQGGMFSDRSFNGEQLKNAAIIANVGSGMGMSTRDIMIGIMTAITESGLINVDYGDRDSLGLFQQRPSMGWGSAEQVTNPEYAARKFFEHLRGVTNRGEMAPWLAAQAVQRSFDPTGANYRQYWDNAQSIFKTGLVKNKHGNFDPMMYGGGKGGWHKPTPFGTFGGSTHDIGVPIGTPVYAVGDGTVVESRYITSGGSPGNGGIAPNGLPYRSYGEMIKLRTSSGTVTYGHLQAGSRVPVGTVVKGGAQIARSGNTGNSSGPHLHLDIGGAYIARSWLASRGISLRKGAQNINYDGTPAVLHKNEAVLTEDINNEFKRGVSAFSDPVSLMQEMMQRAIIPSFKAAKDSIGGGRNNDVTDTGAKATINIGTLNTKNGVSAANTQKDLQRLLPKTDFLALTEMARKFGAIKGWLAKRGWGLLGGRSHDEKRAALAYNKRTQKLNRSGTKLLGKKRGNFVGGREDRYANYGLFTDRDTGRKTWQVSAHTVPTPRMDARHRELFNEQWGNLDKLVRNLKGSGVPVFVSGDLNNNPNRDWWRKPGGLKQFRGRGVDWIFSDPRYAKAVSSSFMKGMHTDHGGAVLAGYKIPQLNVGAQNIRWDNTIANLHKGEAVLTEDINKKFRQGVDNFANGGNSEYNVHVHVNGTNASADAIAQRVVTTIQRQQRRKPQSRRS